MSEVEEHNTEEDCWMVIGNEQTGGPMVYDVTKYLDEHPGGVEVMTELAGQDADEFFEEIGHSMDARDILKGLVIGKLKIDEAEVQRKREAAEAALAKGEGGPNIVVIVVVVLAIMVGGLGLGGEMGSKMGSKIGEIVVNIVS